MAMMTISDPGLGQGFQALVNALSGNPSAMIEADLNRGRRDLLTAQTNTEQQELADLQRAAGAQRALETILSDPSWMTTPEGRASAMAKLSLIKDGLQRGPGFATGAATFTDPNAFTPEAFSNVLLGTGVVNDFAQTPVGLASKLGNDVRIQSMKDDAEYQRALLPGGGGDRAPLAVNPDMALDFNDMIGGALSNRYGGAKIDPALQQMLLGRATQHYQTTRNAQTALDLALAEVQTVLEGQSGGFFGIGADPGTVRAVGSVLPPPVAQSPLSIPDPAPSQTAAPVTVAPGQPAAAASAPAAAANAEPGASAPITERLRQVAPSLVRSVVPDPKGGGWVYVDPNGKSVPVRNGQVFRSPSTGAAVVFRDGEFYEM